jgi:hypothetical protein
MLEPTATPRLRVSLSLTETVTAVTCSVRIISAEPLETICNRGQTCSISNDWEENNTNKFLSDVSRLCEAINGIDEPFRSDGDKLKKRKSFVSHVNLRLISRNVAYNCDYGQQNDCHEQAHLRLLFRFLVSLLICNCRLHIDISIRRAGRSGRCFRFLLWIVFTVQIFVGNQLEH